jgi:hypothetical protein
MGTQRHIVEMMMLLLMATQSTIMVTKTLAAQMSWHCLLQ